MRTASGGNSPGFSGRSMWPKETIAACTAPDSAPISASLRQARSRALITNLQVLNDLLETHAVFLDDQHFHRQVLVLRGEPHLGDSVARLALFYQMQCLEPSETGVDL